MILTVFSTEHSFVKEKVKNTLRSLTYNYIDLDLKQFYVDRKRIRILKNMNINFAILKPYKGNGIVILKRSDYLSITLGRILHYCKSNNPKKLLIFEALLIQYNKP